MTNVGLCCGRENETRAEQKKETHASKVIERPRQKNTSQTETKLQAEMRPSPVRESFARQEEREKKKEEQRRQRLRQMEQSKYQEKVSFLLKWYGWIE